MNITVLAFQVQKQSVDQHPLDRSEPPWQYIARFPTLEAAQGFISQNAKAYMSDPQRCVLRVFCEPADVAKAIRAAQLSSVGPGDE